MTSRVSILSLFGVGAAICLSGCTVAAPRDLKLEGIKLVATDAIDVEGFQSPRSAQSPTHLRIDLSTRRQLGEAAKRFELNLYGMVQDCDAVGGDRKQFYAPGPYLGRYALPLRGSDITAVLAAEGHPPNSRGTYSLYLAPRGDARLESDFNAKIPYDLSTRTEPLCVRIGGGNMMGMLLRTNTVRISPEALRAAILQAPAS